MPLDTRNNEEINGTNTPSQHSKSSEEEHFGMFGAQVYNNESDDEDEGNAMHSGENDGNKDVGFGSADIFDK